MLVRLPQLEDLWLASFDELEISDACEVPRLEDLWLTSFDELEISDACEVKRGMEIPVNFNSL